MEQNQWQKIWEESRYPSTEEQLQSLTEAPILSLRHLMNLSAFYSITTEAWQSHLLNVLKKTKKTTTDLEILEIGCGPGATLKVLEPFSKQISGIDISEKLVETCKKAIPNGNFYVCQAIDIDFPPKKLDLVISNSVFQYFPDIDYARVVLNKMLTAIKSGGAGVVLDLPDIEYKSKALQFTKNKIGETLASQHPSRTYYTKANFENFAREKNIEYRIEQQSATGYGSTSFRFNFFFWKK